MQISRGVFACVAVVALAACDMLLGLGQYQDVACIPTAGDCPGEGGTADGTVEGGRDAGLDTGTDAYEASVDASFDAGADADGGLADVATVPIDAPSLLQLWAQWPMPNPDASIGGDSSARLPNPMEYEIEDVADGGDGGDASDLGNLVTDHWTHLVWERTDDYFTDVPEDAASTCAGHGMRLPTRIELVSLIDFTKSPTIDQVVFPQTGNGPYWTSSVYPNEDGSTEPWFVDFSNGIVKHTGLRTVGSVRCVSGGSP